MSFIYKLEKVYKTYPVNETEVHALEGIDL